MKRVFLYFILFPVICFGQERKTTNITSFGVKADGVTDNSAAFIKALKYCSDNNTICFIPRANKSYKVSGTVYLDLQGDNHLEIQSDGAVIEMASIESFAPYLLRKLTPGFKELPIFAFGSKSGNSDMARAFDNENKSFVVISGLQFKGSSQFSQPNNPTAIVSGIDCSVGTIHFKNLTFQDIQGYGIRSFGAENLEIDNIDMDNVGGRGIESKSDAFGDGIYIAALKNNAKVLINKINLKGALTGNKRSRIGITFEFSVKPYHAVITNSSIANFAKSIHVEEPAPAQFEVRNCDFSKFNYGIAMIGNTKAIMNVYKSNLVCSSTDGGIEHGDGGPVINMNNGGQLNFHESKINLDGKRNSYISMVGVKELDNCTIYGNNKNPFFADASTTFSNCKFIDFGGPSYSFFSHGSTISSFAILNSSFSGGGPVNANGQRVNLVISNSKSSKPLISQTFSK